MILATLWACTASTGGERITFTAVARPAQAASDGTLVYTDATSGWTVTLTEAQVAVGPLYLWSGKPTLMGRLRVPGISAAWAGADEFLAGYLRGEVLDQVAFDVLGGADVSIGTGDGTAGESLSAELWLEPPGEAASDSLGGSTFRVAGEATKDGVTVPFRGELTIDDSVIDPDAGQTAALVRRVRGIPLGGELAQDSTLTLTVDATRWLAGVDFADLLDTVPDNDGTYVIAWPDTPWSTFYYQVRQSGSGGPWTLTLDP